MQRRGGGGGVFRWLPFRRRQGRHAPGSTVAARPVSPLAVPTVAAPVYAPVAAPRAYPGLLGEIAALIATGEAWVADPLPLPGTARGSRVQLVFRDGTTASLDPGSDEASALDELARILTGRDAPGT